MIDPSLYPLDPDQELQADDSIERLYVNRKSRFTQVEGPELTPAPPSVGVQPGLSYVKYQSLDGAQYIVELRSGENYTLPQAAQDPLIFTIDTTKTNTNSSLSNQFQAPFYGSTKGSYIINWGDGNEETWSEGSSNLIHTYANAGVYEILIRPLQDPDNTLFGLILATGGAAPAFKNESTKYVSFTQFGSAVIVLQNNLGFKMPSVASLPNGPVNIYNNVGVAMFSGSLMVDVDLSTWNTADNPITGSFAGFHQNMSGGIANTLNYNWYAIPSSVQSAFSYNYSQNSPLDRWDISNCTTLSSTFYRCNVFNQPLNSWNTGNVTTLFACFEDCFVFNQPLNNWNTSKVTNMASVFKNAQAFNQDIGSWDVSSVTLMQSMFRSAIAFNQDIGGWNVSAVTNMGSMFQSASAFNQDLSSWDIGVLTNASNMFTSSGLTTANYDALLVGWAAQAPNIQSGVTLSSVPCNYTIATAQAARDVLTGTYGWTIIDQGGI